MVSSFTSAPRSGFYYFAQGWKLVSQPGIRRFVILPLLVNILLMGGAFWWLFTQLDVWIPTLMSYVPDWLQWLSYLLWPLAVISVLLVFGYFFSTIANWIAAFRYHERCAANHETRMAKICLVSAARNCITNSLLHPWYWANRRAGTVVPV